MRPEQQQAYWKQNLAYIVIILAIWFAVSYFAGLLIADSLDHAMRLGGFPLGFWFANQGSLVIFVVLIFVYVTLMNNLDKKYGVFED
jgi:putative solute:sodium symporter small subunit